MHRWYYIILDHNEFYWEANQQIRKYRQQLVEDLLLSGCATTVDPQLETEGVIVKCSDSVWLAINLKYSELMRVVKTRELNLEEVIEYLKTNHSVTRKVVNHGAL